jgi:NitT/TauT family transport system substrate-binding protein
MIRVVSYSVLVVIAAVAVQSVGVACSARSQSSEPVAKSSVEAQGGAAPMVVRVGAVGTLDEAGFYAALEKGYFQQEHIAIQIESFKSAADMIVPLSTGEIDVGAGAPSAGLYNAVAQGVDLRVVADKSKNRLGHELAGLVIRKDLVDRQEFRGFQDLQGRRVAIGGTASSPEIRLERALQVGGLTSGDIDLVIMSYPDQIAALANGGLDASIMIEPLATETEIRGIAVKWPGAYELGPEQEGAVILYSPEFIQRDVNLAQRFMVAYVRGARLANDAFIKGDIGLRDELVGILIKYTSVKDRELYAKMSIPVPDPNGSVNVSNMQDQMSWYVARGYMKAPVAIDVLVDQRFVVEAVRQLGDYR